MFTATTTNNNNNNNNVITSNKRQDLDAMPRNSIESDRSRSRHRYMNNGNNTSSGSGKGGTPLPQIPDTLMHDPYQPVNRQDYLFHPNRFHQQSQHSQQQQQAPHSHHHSGPGDTRTPVAWTLRDATLSHPIRAATATPSVPFNMATHHSHHLHHQANHAFDSISLHQSSISGRDHRRQHPHPYPYPKKHQANGRHAQRTSSPSATTTSSDDRDEIPIVRHPHHRRQHG